MQAVMLRVLMIVGVLLCSMHLAESAAAHVPGNGAAFHLAADTGDEERREPASTLVHSPHHCPMAPDMRQSASDAEPCLTRGPLFAASVVQLPSRVLPPLLDPPLG